MLAAVFFLRGTSRPETLTVSTVSEAPLDPARVRFWRRAHEIPQIRLAAALGCTQGHLSAFERGEAAFSEAEATLLRAIIGESERAK